jgi:hypothetical protein
MKPTNADIASLAQNFFFPPDASCIANLQILRVAKFAVSIYLDLRQQYNNSAPIRLTQAFARPMESHNAHPMHKQQKRIARINARIAARI